MCGTVPVAECQCVRVDDGIHESQCVDFIPVVLHGLLAHISVIVY